MMDYYSIPTKTVSFTEEIKKSRFITYLAHVENVQAAKQFIQEIKKQHPDARHHCWAYVAGKPTDSQVLGFSDDGEPAGTAGKPILSQLMGSQIGEIIAVVVRYYGGILLGTGGLVKAYGHGVQQALKILLTAIKIPCLAYSLSCDYHQLQMIETLIKQYDGTITRIDYLEKVTLQLMLPAQVIPQITQKLQDMSKGILTLAAIQS